MFFRSLYISCFIVSLSLALTCNLFVAPDGSSSTCTVDSPCSFQQALNIAKTDGRDDVICLKRGIYNVDTTLRLDNDTGYPEDNNLTILGEVDDEGNPVSVVRSVSVDELLLIDTCSPVEGECQIVRNRPLTIKNIRFENPAGIAFKILSSNSPVYIKNVSVRGCISPDKRGAISIYTYSGDIALENIVISNNMSKTGGFHIRSINGNILIKNSDIKSNRGSELTGGGYIFSKNGDIRIINSIFLRNISHNNCGGVLLETTNGNIFLINNDIAGNTADIYAGLCIYTDNDNPEINIYNNIFWNNLSTGYGQDVYINDDNDGNLVSSYINLRYNFSSCDFDLGNHSSCLEVERGSFLNTYRNITDVTPSFENYPLDLHLSSGSVCIDAGYNSAPYLPDKDKDGNQRIHGPAVDLGPYEYGSLPVSFIVEVVKVGDGYVYSFPAGISCGDTCSYNFPVSYISVTLTARPSAGYFFDRWEGDCSVCGKALSCNIRLDGNKRCRAIFTELTTGGGGCSFSISYSVSQSIFNLFLFSLIPALVFFRKLKRG